MTTEVAAPKQSRLGKRPVEVPGGVNIKLADGTFEAQGPKGKLSLKLPESITVKHEDKILSIHSDAPDSDAPRLQGLGRALVANIVKGVSEGFTQVLELHGTGYRCEVKANAVHLTVGLSHPASYALPESVKATVPGDSKGTVLVLESPDKAVLGEVSAGIRRIRPPEPYGGKGIRYRGEQIRRKAGKAGKGRK
jgi:large subunit ribosomal protein L6